MTTLNFPIDLSNWTPESIAQFLITLASHLKESDIFKDMSKEEIFSSLLSSACFLGFICIGGRQILMENRVFSRIEAVDLKLKKFMEDQAIKNEIFISAVQNVQKVNEVQLQLIKDLSQQIGKMSPPQWSTSTGESSSSVRIKSKNRKR